MAKLGRSVTDPRSGSYCHITLDRSGFASDSVFVCHLDTALEALVKHGGTAADVKARRDVLTPLEEPRP